MPTNYETARRVLPDRGARSFAWRVDRALTARKAPLSEWKKGTNRADWDRYDTPDRRPLPTKRSKLKQRYRTDSSAEAVLMDEPERMVRTGQESRRLLEQIKGNFYDFESFKKEARRILASDRGGFDSFISDIDAKGGNRGYEALYNTQVVQGWLRENTHGVAVLWLKDRFKITDTKAKSVYNRMSERNKIKVIESAVTGKRARIRPLPRVEVRGQVKPFIPQRTRIRQVSRTGTSYLRTRPQRFTDMEIRFLRNNAPRMPLVRLLEAHRGIFQQTPRTIGSLKNKVNRLGLRRG